MAHADLAVRRSSTAVRHTENAEIYFYMCDLVFARISVQAVPNVTFARSWLATHNQI